MRSILQWIIYLSHFENKILFKIQRLIFIEIKGITEKEINSIVLLFVIYIKMRETKFRSRKIIKVFSVSYLSSMKQ